MPGFNIDNDTLCWEMPNLEFNANGQFALSSLVIMANPPSSTEPVLVSTSLVERDEYNTDGIIYVSPTKTGRISYTAKSFEFWNLDASRPRNLMFTLRGLDLKTLKFISVILALA